MSETTIAWTERTWNPVRGCSMAKGSEATECLNCYAARMAARGLPGMNSPTTGEPFAIMRPSGPRWTGKVELIPHMLDVPLRRKKPTTWFVNSMSDLFHEALSDEAIDRVFAVMGLCGQHVFQALTKRPDRMRQYMLSRQRSSRFWKDACPTGYTFDFQSPLDGKTYSLLPFPLPNVWIGTSIGVRSSRYRIGYLRETPAAVRFLSLEPLLEDLGTLDLSGIHWVIVGGESGPGARPCNTEWIRSIVEQCKATGTRVFVKQLGAHVIQGGERRRKKDKKGGDMHEWEHDLRIREMPCR